MIKQRDGRANVLRRVVSNHKLSTRNVHSKQNEHLYANVTEIEQNMEVAIEESIEFSVDGNDEVGNGETEMVEIKGEAMEKDRIKPENK